MKIRFEHLTLKNWRNFREVAVDLAQRAFVVGPNASGKTNLLDALRFLHDIAEPGGGLVQALARRGGIAHLRSLHAGQDSHIRLEVKVDVGGTRWGYALELAETKTRALQIIEERVTRGKKLVLRRPAPRDKADRKLLEQTHLEQLGMNDRFRDLARALASVRHVQVVPQIAKSAIRIRPLAQFGDAAGSDFIEQLANLPPAERRHALNRIQRFLRRAVPQFSELRIRRDELGTPHLQAKYRDWRPRGIWQDEVDFSDGTLRLTGLFWALVDGGAPLLLEEPELSLHRDVVRQLPRLIARANEDCGRQVIVSTHAEEILEDAGVAPEEVLILEPTQEGTRVRLASEDPYLVSAARAGVPLGPLVTGRTRPEKIEQLSLVALEERG